MRSRILLFSLTLLQQLSLFSQSDSCRLNIGTNLSGICDYCTELPFVDLMHSCRAWGTQNVVWYGGGKNPWDSQVIGLIEKDSAGYPLEVPFFQQGLGLDTAQLVYTVWANTEAWPAGDYTLLYDGEGKIAFGGDAKVISQSPGRIQVQVTPGVNNLVHLKIQQSLKGNHIRNLRFLMPGYETTYAEAPFNPLWTEKLLPFTTLRFMDWGSTNGWGCEQQWYECADDTLTFNWSQRAHEYTYTWSGSRGVPYEQMIRLCNGLQKDAWVCVPHNASNDYISQMAALFRDQLDPSLHLYVEYSNETWNWIFPQAQYLNNNGQQNVPWPERIVPYIQNCMDIWTQTFEGQLSRITRVVGVQAAWQDVSNRVVFNMKPGSFDAFSPAAYFGLSQEADAALDSLGSQASAADVASWVRKGREKNEKTWLTQQRQQIALPLGIPMIYYEGGQHITPHPFGTEPTYAQALLDIQRDTAMYHLYTEWFDFLETLNTQTEPACFMNFSFINPRSAKYGSWGLLETLDQDTALIPAPKYRAVLERIQECQELTLLDEEPDDNAALAFPNPFGERICLQSSILKGDGIRYRLYDTQGLLRQSGTLWEGCIAVQEDLPSGLFVLQWEDAAGMHFRKMIRR